MEKAIPTKVQRQHVMRNGDCKALQEIKFRWGKTERYLDLLLISFREYVKSDEYCHQDIEDRELDLHDMSLLIDTIHTLGVQFQKD